MKNKRGWKDQICSGVIPDIILCGFLSLILEVILEVCDWRSIELFLVFFEERTWVFFYNCLIIFLTFIPVFLTQRKLFVYILVSVVWLAIGITNGTMLGYRNTPFSAVDIALLKSTFPVLTNYLARWQIIALAILFMIIIVAMVCLFLYCPKSTKKMTLSRRIACVIAILLVFAGSTQYGVQKGLLEKRFSNIRLAYRAYGTPYCYGLTFFDNGIDRPMDYTKEKMDNLKKNINKKYDKLDTQEKQTPNIIFLQLESFFDITRMKDLSFSEDPIPFFRSLSKKYTSGLVSTPSYGAGTVNTEFEILTGMNKNFFGAGEYPYKSILMKTTCESMPYILKEDGYTAHAIHDNNASFYDRDYVYTNLGFDTFTTMEMMNIVERSPADWPKDKVLTRYIKEALDSTDNQDFVYAVSVQGHGDYPQEPLESNTIEVTGAESEEKNNQFAFYTQQIHEMDLFLEELITYLENREEDTVLVVFGDHLPSLDIETDQLSKGDKFETDYFIWDNIGLKKEDEDLQAYKLYSKLFAQLGNGNGILNRYHQTYRGNKNYSDNLKLLQYDMLYGHHFVYGIHNKYEQTDMRFGTKDVEFTAVRAFPDDNMVFFTGIGFTPYTRIYVNGVLQDMAYYNQYLIKWSKASIKEGDEIYIIQKSKTNQHPILWQSPTYIYHEDGTLTLKEEKQ